MIFRAAPEPPAEGSVIFLMSTIRSLLLGAAMCLTLSLAFAWSRTRDGRRVRPADSSATSVLIVASLMCILAMEIWRLLRETKETLQRIYVSLVVTLWIFIATTCAWAIWHDSEYTPGTTYMPGGIFAVAASCIIGVALGMVVRASVSFRSVVIDASEGRELILVPPLLHTD